MTTTFLVEEAELVRKARALRSVSQQELDAWMERYRRYLAAGGKYLEVYEELIRRENLRRKVFGGTDV